MANPIMSRIEDILDTYENGGMYNKPLQSRVEKILMHVFYGDPYTGPVESRVEKELMELTGYTGDYRSRIEEIIRAKTYGTLYTGLRLSRIEDLAIKVETGEYIFVDIEDNLGNAILDNNGFKIQGKVRKV